MATYDFSKLEAKFPEIVAQMDKTFSSHKFLLELARQNQLEYVKALYEYKETTVRVNPAPFQEVHGQLMKRLKQHTELVKLIRDDMPSKDIFGKSQTCAEWQKK